MRRRAPLAVVFLTVLWVFSVQNPWASAEPPPGTVIDKTNWQEIEGLVPDAVLNWIKKGDEDGDEIGENNAGGSRHGRTI